MNTQPTLFSRYKRMINLLWEDGQRKYTAAELNLHVGHHENITNWKRWNNNIFYTTRTYQTALKELGCITKIKRGLWQINAPIPEWFGSYHINALSSDSALKALERSSIYWQSLPDYQKVNPWKNIDPMRVIASTQESDLLRALQEADNDAQMEDDIAGGMRNCGDTDYYTPNFTNTMNKTTDCVMQTITGTILIEEFPQLTMTTQVSVYPAGFNDEGYGVDICDWQYVLKGKEITTEAAQELCSAFIQTDENSEDLLKRLRNAAHNNIKIKLINDLIADAIAADKLKAPTTEKTYTKAQVEQLLKAFVEKATDDIRDVLQGTLENIDADDVVELDWDSYNKSMSVSLDISSNIDDAVNEARDVMENILRDPLFDIEEELI